MQLKVLFAKRRPFCPRGGWINISVSTWHADGPAPLRAKESEGSMMTYFEFRMCTGQAVEGQEFCYCSSEKPLHTHQLIISALHLRKYHKLGRSVLESCQLDEPHGALSTISRMQRCVDGITDNYRLFPPLFDCYMMLEIKPTKRTTVNPLISDAPNPNT